MSKFNCSDIRRILKLPLGKRVDLNIVERWSASFWNVSKQKQSSDGPPFVIMFPPPNITGNLHLGHALTAALQDALIRQRRMLGRQAIWIPGFDHAGLSTQAIVEKQLLHRQGISRIQLGREKFVALANEWKDLKRDEMRSQLDRLGLALNWEREYFTTDEKSSLAVRTAFIKLFKEGIIYRSVKPVFWSQEMQTTLSDIEVENVGGSNRYTRTGELVVKRPLNQWFISADLMALKAVQAVEDGSIEMIPANYKNTWSAWLLDNGVEDWCISRQSWWGHRIPAYKLQSDPDVKENWVAAGSLEEAARQLGPLDSIEQDPDVLDTWFSSSLLPLTVSGWPDQEEFAASIEKNLFPLDIMETGFDILNYWVSKMVMTSIALEKRIPFKLILLHGMICDSKGKKMSKSKGNVIDPLDVIDGTSLESLQQRTKDLHSSGIVDDDQLETALQTQEQLFPKGVPACGADGLRAYLLSHDIQEEVIKVQLVQLEKIRRLSNKVWNLFRFVIQLIETLNVEGLEIDYELAKLDRGSLDAFDLKVLKEQSRCVSLAHDSFEKSYQLLKSFTPIEIFLSVHLSSAYIGHAKPLLNNEKTTPKIRKLKLQLIITCLITSTKLLHPFMPHLTEFLHQKLVTTLNAESLDREKKEGEIPLTSLSLGSYPELNVWEQYSTDGC